MPDIWMDVDAALSEVPVNIMPLIDDTDFKTRETAVAYNAAGMDLVWNFVTSAGAFTQTAVTPTTAGTYDWTHQGDGMYTIEIPASGGASINNDTEGYGWFTGVATGVLPWRGPIIGFRAAAVNDALIDGGDLLDVNVTQFGGTNATTSGGRPEVNASHVSGTLQTAGDLATLITAVDDLVDTEVAAIFNRIGAPVGASISADIASVLAAILVVDDYVDTEIAAMPASVWSYTVEGSFTAVQLLRIALAAMAGKLSGAATTTVSIRDLGDTKNRIVATVTADGDRTAVTLDGS